jgi:ABC-type amino acid transport substrate-binding protein
MKKFLLGASCLFLFSPALCMSGAEPPRENLLSPIPYPPISKQKLIVGVAVGPPFDIRQADGSWTGISVELWRQLAKELNLEYEFRETNLSGTFVGTGYPPFIPF